MALPIEQFFFDRFIAYNKDRYKDTNPGFVIKLDRLTVDQVTFTNMRKTTDGSGKLIYTVDMDCPGVFNAKDQSYTPGDYVFNGAANLNYDGTVNQLQLSHQYNPGIYKQLEDGAPAVDTEGAVLVGIGNLTEAQVKAQVKAKCVFELQDSEITVSPDLKTATVDSMTVVGTMNVAESINDDGSAYYDGFYAYDGTVTY